MATISETFDNRLEKAKGPHICQGTHGYTIRAFTLVLQLK